MPNRQLAQSMLTMMEIGTIFVPHLRRRLSRRQWSAGYTFNGQARDN
jgi:hypothetical protein